MFLSVRRYISSRAPRKVLSSVFLNKRALSSANITSKFSEVQIPEDLLEEHIFAQFDKFPHKIAAECAITGRKYTYDDIRIKTRNLNRSLRKKLKLQQGDVVGLFLPNLPEYPIATFAIIQAGLVCTTLNPIYTPEEISRQLKDSNTKALITTPELWQNAKIATENLKINIPILVVQTKDGQSLPDGAVSFSEFINQSCDINDPPRRGFEDIILMPYSSGTTGLPKGVLLSNKNLVANMMQCTGPETSLIGQATETYQDIVPLVLPMFHIYGFLCCHACMLRQGAKLVTLPKFTPELYIDTLKKHKPTLLFTVPPIVIFLTMHPEVKPEYFDSVKILMSGAAPLGGDDEERFLSKIENRNVNVIQGYGLTETSPVLTIIPPNVPKSPGSVGSILPNTTARVINIDDPTATNLGPNKVGELIVKGPQVMQGYHNRPEETEKAFIDGWFRTGDMVYYNDQQHFFVTDRIKELIKVKAFQVPPAELEEIIRGFDNVADCAVIGVPHKLYGEVPRAYVVPKRERTVDGDKLYEFVAQKVAEYKKLDGGIAIVDIIPKNASGKILRRQLKLQYLEENKA